MIEDSKHLNLINGIDLIIDFAESPGRISITEHRINIILISVVGCVENSITF